MNELKELLSICKASVSITVNQHRDYHQTVEQYIEEQAQLDEYLIDEIGLEVYAEMQKTNTIVELQAYPDTPIGSYRVIHHDIDKAIKIMLECVSPVERSQKTCSLHNWTKHPSHPMTGAMICINCGAELA